MSEYIGQIVTIELKDGQGKYRGRLISNDGKTGKVVLSKGILPLVLC